PPYLRPGRSQQAGSCSIFIRAKDKQKRTLLLKIEKANEFILGSTMASAESINVEFDTSRNSGGSGGGGSGSGNSGDLWQRVKYQLDPNNHTLLENVLVGVTFVMFILIITLAATHGGGGGGAGGGIELGNTCQSQPCLLRAASSVALANVTASPCEDFYSYACGLAPYIMRLNPGVQERTIPGELSRENEDRLEEILRSPVRRNTTDSYERKVKKLFEICTNDLITERFRGGILAQFLSSNLYLLNASSVDQFDLNLMISQAYLEYGADVFFEYLLTENFLDNDKYTISINRGGIEMRTSSYLSSDETSAKHRQAYSTYIRTVAAFLQADTEPGKLDQSEALSRVDTFVVDVMEVETELARDAASPEKPPLDPSNLVALSTMDFTYQPIQWSNFFRTAFGSNAPSSVAVQDPDYLVKMVQYIRQLMADPTQSKRKLSNYINWRIISRHVGDLSSGYVHAKREFQLVIATQAYAFENRFDYCYRKTRHWMRHAVSALFVADHLSSSVKGEVDSMYKALQDELTSSIDRLTWLSNEEKSKAKEKVGGIRDFIGYSETEVSDSYLDAFYKTLSIGDNDYLLQLAINRQAFHLQYQSSRIGKQPDRSEWDGSTYDTNLHLNNQLVRLTIPAGSLQWPYYGRGLPDYVNFATLGEKISAELVKSIDATGQLFDKTGAMNPMWSRQETYLGYVEKASCLNRTFSAMRAGPYATQSGPKYVSIENLLVRHLRNIIAAADGLRLSIRTYLRLRSDTELPLPLASWNQRQTFFLAWAQNQCYSRNPDYSVTKAETLRALPEETLVNGILSTMPEFAQTFGCPAGSNMARPTSCEGIFYV
uniref:Neprilysin n=1 Tax=Macrostomum lignano TaxID=282301 RepID=A0A1I8GIA4_9PLAT